jgi:hypothetical protein
MRNGHGQHSNADHQFAVAVGVDSAGAGSWKAPSCDTDGSVASAWQVVGSGAPLEGNTYPTAGVGQKLSQGFGDRVPNLSASGAAGSPSLDTYTNNRHSYGEIPLRYRRPLGRGRFCGRLSIAGVDPKTNRKKFQRLNCGSWTCSYCGPRKALRARRAIRCVAEALDLRYFLTLTLDPKKLDNRAFAVKHLRLSFNKFREYLRRQYGVAPKYVCIVEFTKAGLPHLHVLLDRYVDQRWISNTWATLGGGRIVDIRAVTINKVARYLSKYLTKELLLSAPKGTRRITTARGIKLFPKFNSGIAWELIKSTIWWLLAENRAQLHGYVAEDRQTTDFFDVQKGLFNSDSDAIDRQRGFLGMISEHYDEDQILKGFDIPAHAPLAHESETIPCAA